MRKFLENSVFYPCSGLDGTPVQFLGKQFQSFVYADHSIDRETLENKCYSSKGFRGYKCISIDTVENESLFGPAGPSVDDQEIEAFSESMLAPKDIFIAKATFQRLPDFTEAHGPLKFTLMFCRCEAITAYVSAYNRVGIKPKCVCYICPGIGFGGNYHKFPRKFGHALKMNPKGLPKYILYDKLGGNPKMGDYFRLIKKYERIDRFDYKPSERSMSNVTLAELK